MFTAQGWYQFETVNIGSKQIRTNGRANTDNANYAGVRVLRLPYSGVLNEFFPRTINYDISDSTEKKLHKEKLSRGTPVLA